MNFTSSEVAKGWGGRGSSARSTGKGTKSGPDLAEELARLPKRKRISYLQLLSAAIVLLLLAGFGLAVANAGFDWGVIRHYFTESEMLTGVRRTIVLTILAMVLGLILGTIGGVCRLSTNRVVSGVAWLYVWFFRGTPVLVQLLLWFNLALIFPSIGIPGLFSGKTINLITPLVAATLGLGVNEGAYLSEIIRGGILAVDPGQREAAQAIGASSLHMYRRIVLPQALRIILPTLGNETIGMLKFTSLASLVSYAELLETSEQIYFVTTKVMEMLIVASAWYLILTSILTIGQYYLERYYGRAERVGRPRAMVEVWIMHVVRTTLRRKEARDDRAGAVLDG
jgi:polar amino acid transport system permease protein